jgi:hypothetical protein
MKDTRKRMKLKKAPKGVSVELRLNNGSRGAFRNNIDASAIIFHPEICKLEYQLPKSHRSNRLGASL